MNIALLFGRLSYVFISFIILFSIVPAILSNQSNSDRMIVVGQETNTSLASDAEILASINQTYLSLIPLMIREVENTNASDIPIRQIMEATPSNVTALQDIVKNSSHRAAQSDLNSFSTTSSLERNGSSTLKPQDLIPVVVNMTQNTNASDIPIQNVIDIVPSNVTALQDIVKNSSHRAAQSDLNSFSTTSSLDRNGSSTLKPQDLIPVVVNMTQNTNASDLGFMRVINSTPNLETLNRTGLD